MNKDNNTFNADGGNSPTNGNFNNALKNGKKQKNENKKSFMGFFIGNSNEKNLVAPVTEKIQTQDDKRQNNFVGNQGNKKNKYKNDNNNVHDKKQISEKNNSSVNGEQKNSKTKNRKKQKNNFAENKNLQNVTDNKTQEIMFSSPVGQNGKAESRNQLKVCFLGGVGEIGKNMTVLEYNGDIMIIDAGLTFPSEEMLGIDLVIPDISYLVQNKEKIRGIVLTHGHEDHIGGLPYLEKELNIPVYGTKLTLTLADGKLREHRLSNVSMNCIKPGSVIKLGCFSVEFINVNHSIAGAVALSITTPVGVVFHTGDYKIDYTPINGEYMDLPRIAEIGKKGVLLLLADSTNIERPGFTMSERVVGETLDHLFSQNTERRLIVATFASNVHRLQQILDIAIRYKRKVAFSGRSMLNVADAALRIGELKYPADLVVDIEKIKNIPDKNLVIVSTGSQGEPMSALTRMASGEFNKVQIGKNDTIIISASPIPGNEKMIYRVINNLYRKGAEVVYESLEKIHVSGHACQEEIKLLHSLVNPKFFIPVHGEYRHLKKHALLAQSLGMNPSCILLADIGNSVLLTSKTMKFGNSFTAGSRLVDGLSIDDGESFVLRDRKHIAEDGLFVVVLGVSKESGEVLSGPDIIKRGFSWTDENQLMEEAKQNVLATIKNIDIKGDDNRNELSTAIRRSMKNYIFKKTKQNPMIVPIITEV